MKRVYLTLVVFIAMASLVHGANDFEDLTVPSDGYYNGSDGAGQFTSGDAVFTNLYDDSYGSPYWEGFAYSGMTTAPPKDDPAYQFCAITGTGATGSATYSVAYTSGFYGTPSQAQFATPTTVDGVYVTNTTWAYMAMHDGDQFAKPFGGTTGDDPDYFKLTIKGYDNADNLTGEVEFYLADYRFANNSLDYIVDEWTWVDLISLGTVAKLVFELDSSDKGQYGINTPSYFAMDNLNSPPPSSGGGGGGGGGCFIASAGSNDTGLGIALITTLVSAGLGVLGIHRK